MHIFLYQLSVSTVLIEVYAQRHVEEMATMGEAASPDAPKKPKEEEQLGSSLVVNGGTDAALWNMPW